MFYNSKGQVSRRGSEWQVIGMEDMGNINNNIKILHEKVKKIKN